MKMKYLFSILKKKCTRNSNIVVTECSPGYTGVGCNITCYNLLYGDNCQRVCTCSPEEFCDFMYGCLKSKFIRVRACMYRVNSSYLFAVDKFVCFDLERLSYTCTWNLLMQWWEEAKT